MMTDKTCVILSGGKNRRMGVNKALLSVNGKTIIEIIYDKVSKLFAEVILISNEPELYDFIDAPKYKDIYPGKGPLAGIHSGLCNSSTQKNFIISCDMPLVENEMIEYLAGYKTDKLITLPMNNHVIQTLCGIYDKECITVFEERLSSINRNEEGNKQRSNSLICAAIDCGAEVIDVARLSFYNDRMFFNLNNMDDFDSLKKMFGPASEDS